MSSLVNGYLVFFFFFFTYLLLCQYMFDIPGSSIDVNMGDEGEDCAENDSWSITGAEQLLKLPYVAWMHTGQLDEL